MTPKEQKFVEAYLVCADPEQAAVAAGYSPKGARKAGWRLLQRPDVLAELARRKPAPVNLDPLQYLLSVMRDPGVPLARRVRAAVAAAPYMHPKSGAGGKKSQAADAAQKAATGKFKPSAGPKVIPFKR